jgi:quercetin dioxygenase-like cupin family protein
MLSRSKASQPSPFLTEVLLSRFALRIIHIEIPAGESLSTHAAAFDAALIVVHGDGRVTVENGDVDVCAGSVVGLLPGELHAVHAQSPLGVLLIQTPADVVRQLDYHAPLAPD